MIKTRGQFVANIRIIRILTSRKLRQRKMLAYQQRDPPNNVTVKTHTFQHRGRMTGTLRSMIGNPRTLADIVQNTSQQQRLIMPIIITVSTRCFTTKPRDHLNRMTVNRVTMRSRSARTITNRQPFRNQTTRNINKINLLPHLQQRGTARKQTQEQTTRLIIPRAIINRT